MRENWLQQLGDESLSYSKTAESKQQTHESRQSNDATEQTPAGSMILKQKSSTVHVASLLLRLIQCVTSGPCFSADGCSTFSFIVPSDVAPELLDFLSLLQPLIISFSLLNICPDCEPAGVPDVHMNLHSLRCAFTIQATAPGLQLTFS